MDPSTKLSAALQPTRSMKFYTMVATLPVILISAILLFTNISGTTLIAVSLLGAAAGIIGFVRLLSEITLDIAGYPEYKLPIWSVFYLIIYLISIFTFIIFALTIPGTSNKTAFLDALYMSLCAYTGQATRQVKEIRFIPVIESALSMFLNVVIITKFVSAF